MKTFLCWAPDNGETQEDARAVLANYARDAAQDFAEHRFDGDPFDALDVAVLCADDEVRMFTVDVENEPSFSVMEHPRGHWKVK